MGRVTTKPVLRAYREWLKAPDNAKPTALYLARKFKVHESTIHRARERWIAIEAKKVQP